jgi:hypothetical protein
MAAVRTPWPSSEIIQELVEKSSGYFVYASTVIKFIDDKNFRPKDRLDILMGLAEPDLALLALINYIIKSCPVPLAGRDISKS